MRDTTMLRTPVLAALFSLVAVSGCQTWERSDLTKDRKRSTQQAIGVRVIDSGLELVPYIARVRQGDTVIWYSPDGELRIEFLKAKAGAGPTPLRNPPCEKRSCVLQIDSKQPYGAYPYYPYVTTPDGRVYKLNQGEVDIRG